MTRYGNSWSRTACLLMPRPFWVWPTRWTLVEATDEDVDELAAETGMPKLKQRKFKRALAGLRGDSA